MIDGANSARQFLAGHDRGDLETNRMLLFAVVRAIEVIGEAASRVASGV
jgi:uncharacterized protein with HEPN domain